jgi:hypothetical protein
MQNSRLRLGKLLRFPALILAIILLGSFSPANIGGKVSGKSAKRTVVSSTTVKNNARSAFVAAKMLVYDSLHLFEAGLSRKVFEMALKGMARLVKNNQVHDNIIAIVDFSQPSVNKRLYVVDLENYELLYNTWVAHGVKSGKGEARSFSNKPSSFKSSLGFYVTGNTYQGSNGYSLKLQGLERGINDYAFRRGIVMHGADYVNEEYINSQGYIGRSHGCPAVPMDVCQSLIDHLKEGSCLFIYHPSSTYYKKSRLLR